MDLQSVANQAPDATIRAGTPPDGASFQQQQQQKPQEPQAAAQTATSAGDDDDDLVIDKKQFREVLKDRNSKNRKLQELEKELQSFRKRDEDKKTADMTEAEKARKALDDAQKELEHTRAELKRRDVLIGLSNSRVDPAYQEVIAELYQRRSGEVTLEEFLQEQRKQRPALFQDLVATAQPAVQQGQQPSPASAGGPQAGGASGSQRVLLETELRSLRAKGSRHPFDVAREAQIIRQLGALKG